jgi:hypothetical protein
MATDVRNDEFTIRVGLAVVTRKKWSWVSISRVSFLGHRCTRAFQSPETSIGLQCNKLTMADGRGTRLIASCWSLTAAAGILLILRVYCKLWRGRGLWWDDHLLIISWVHEP